MKKIKLLLCGIVKKEFNNSLLAPYILKSYLEQYKYINKQIDINVVEDVVESGGQKIIKKILDCSPDIIGFSTYQWNINLILSLVDKIKQINNCKIVLGGPEASFRVEELLENNKKIDYIVVGEGEKTFEELLVNLIEHKPVSSIMGLGCQTENSFFVAPQRPKIKDMSILKPVYDKFDFKDKTSVILETSRGCPYKCKHCTWQPGKTIRWHTYENIESEIRTIVKQRDIKYVYITDSDVFLNPEHGFKVLDLVQKYNIHHDIQFNLETNPACLSEETIAGLSKYENICVSFSVISFSVKVLKACDRIINKNKAIQNIKNFSKNKSVKSVFKVVVIFGLPLETTNSFVKTTIKNVFNIPKAFVEMLIFSVLPGSEFAGQSKKYGLVFEKKSPNILKSNNDIVQEDVTIMRFLLHFIHSQPFGKVVEQISIIAENTPGLTEGEIVANIFFHILKGYKNRLEELEHVAVAEDVLAFLANSKPAQLRMP